MTRPSGTLERRRLYTTMTLSRGTMEVDGAHATADKEDESEDLDDIIRRESGRSDEDMFLPQPIPSLIQSLPSLLQKSRKIASYQQNWTSDQLLERKKLQSLNNHRKWISRIFPPAMQVKVSCRGFGVFSVEESLLLEDMMDIKLLLEYLPALRRIGCVERAIEHLLRESGEEQPITSRRTTRRQAKTARYHYFDKLAGQHRSDDLKQESSNIGALMAESFLVYDQIKNI